jgi:hypothetical protein
MKDTREALMQTISAQIVESACEKLAEIPDDDFPRLVEDMQKDQPEIMAFLMAAGHDDFNQAERELQFYLGAMVWLIMREGTPPPHRVGEERLDQLIDRTEKMAEFLMGESDADFENSAMRIFDNHNQVNVLRYIVEALFEDEEEMEKEMENLEMEKSARENELELDESDWYEGEDFEERDEDEDAPVRPLMKGMIFLHLKTVIEALDQ